VRLAITLELVALVASPTNQHPIVTDAPPAEPPADLPVDAQPAPRHVPAVTALEDRAPKAGEAGHDTGTATCTDTRHPVREMPAQPAAESRHAQAALPADTNGCLPVPVPLATADRGAQRMS
jgi:hypothetical protein